MSVQTQIDRIASAVTSALSALTAKGVTVPEGANVESLAALIESIEAGGGGGIRATYGTVVPASSTAMNYVAIEHGLGVRPSFILSFVLPDGNTTTEKDQARWGFSSHDYGSIVLYKNGSTSTGYTEIELDVESTMGYWDATKNQYSAFAIIQQVNDVSFKVNYLFCAAGKTNVWIAFADPILWS